MHKSLRHLRAPTLAVATLLAGAVAALLAAAAAAQTTLAPQQQRITDGSIRADQRGYESLQARIAAINAAGRPLRDYHLAKSQCWLDTSFHEYSRNDRGSWPQAAMGESETLIRGIEARQASLPMDTPLVAGADRLRPDLWQRAQALRGSTGWACAAAKAACAEVELVHAGHEHAQIGWRHAKPYVQIAEDLVAEAEALAKNCAPPPAPAPPAPPAPPPPPPPPVAAPAVASIWLSQRALVLFNFDKHTLADITPASLESLHRLLEFRQNTRLDKPTVRLEAHADRLNSTGQRDYNQRLSEKRAETVKQWLVSKGFDPAHISVTAAGDSKPAEACPTLKDTPQGRNCLLPNRRVDVTVEGMAPGRR